MANSNSFVQAIPNNPTPPIIIHQDNSAFPTNIILDETNYPLCLNLWRCALALTTNLKTLPEQPKTHT